MDYFDSFYNKALHFLSYRPRSEKEVREYLKRKSQSIRQAQDEKAKVKIDDDVIGSIVNKLKEQKFLDDEEFARWFLRSRLTTRPKALRVLKMELKQKGISPELIEVAVKEVSEGAGDDGYIADDLQTARKIIEKKVSRYQKLKKDEIYQKLGSMLARRGYSWDTIREVLRDINID